MEDEDDDIVEEEIYYIYLVANHFPLGRLGVEKCRYRLQSLAIRWALGCVNLRPAASGIHAT